MIELKLTDVKINLLDNETSKVKAIAEIELSGCIIIKNFMIIHSDNGKYFVNLPSAKTGENSYAKQIDITNKNVKDKIFSAILKKYYDTKKSGWQDKPGVSF
jgi:DNA-binding cell septation regulator SpoVG